MSARRWRVLFDPDATAEDLAHATKAARDIGEQAIARLRRDGINREQLYACKAEGRDGTRLPGCVKIYLPPPDGRCGIGSRAAHRRARSVSVLPGVRCPPPAARLPAPQRLPGRGSATAPTRRISAHRRFVKPRPTGSDAAPGARQPGFSRDRCPRVGRAGVARAVDSAPLRHRSGRRAGRGGLSQSGRRSR